MLITADSSQTHDLIQLINIKWETKLIDFWKSNIALEMAFNFNVA